MRRNARTKPKAPSNPRATRWTQRFPTTVVLAALGLACALLIAIWLIPAPRTASADRAMQSAHPADASKWTVGMLRANGLRLVVSGRDDAAAVLDARQFSSARVRQGYWIASQIPAVLNQLYCWCGCENRGVHRSNLQCFEDMMAQDCPVCLGTAEIAYDMTKKGITDAAKIQAAVDVRWAPKR